MKLRAAIVVALVGVAACSPAAEEAAADGGDGKFLSQPLVSEIYTADPSAHVWDGKLYVYPSHDIDAGIPDDDLARIKAPVGVIWGRGDRMTPLATATDTVDRLGWPLRVVEDAAHVPHMEQPERFRAALADLI